MKRYNTFDAISSLALSGRNKDVYTIMKALSTYYRTSLSKGREVKIIILTGHEEFEYAKKGIKVGIADFLLKPINDDEIRKTALKAKEKIMKERSHMEEYDRLKAQLEHNLPFLREKFFNGLILNSSEPGSIDEKLEFFNIKTKEDPFQAAVVEVFNAGMEDSAHEEKRLLLYAFLVVFRQLLRQRKRLTRPPCFQPAVLPPANWLL